MIHIPKYNNYEFIMTTRYKFLRQPEGYALTKADSKYIGDFLQKDIIYRHKAFYHLIINRGLENKGFIEVLIKRVGIYRLRISVYNLKANGGIKGNHNDIRNALTKIDSPQKDNLPVVLFAQRTLVKNNTSFTLYYLLFGEDVILPLETTVPT